MITNNMLVGVFFATPLNKHELVKVSWDHEIPFF